MSLLIMTDHTLQEGDFESTMCKMTRNEPGDWMGGTLIFRRGSPGPGFAWWQWN